jgi:hypothetical protein
MIAERQDESIAAPWTSAFYAAVRSLWQRVTSPLKSILPHTSGVVVEHVARTADGVVVPARVGADGDLIRRCCTDDANAVDPRGLRLRGLTVRGGLDLAGVDVAFPLVFHECWFEQPLVLDGAEVRSLVITGSPALPGLLGSGLRVRGGFGPVAIAAHGCPCLDGEHDEAGGDLVVRGDGRWPSAVR